MARVDWNRFGEDVAPLLQAADRLRRAQGRARRAGRSGDPTQIREAITELQRASDQVDAALAPGND